MVDTAGQDEYSIFPTQYSLDIDGYILVYSIDSEKSFEVVQVDLHTTRDQFPIFKDKDLGTYYPHVFDILP